MIYKHQLIYNILGLNTIISTYMELYIIIPYMLKLYKY